VGLFAAVREWRQARRRGAAITLAEKVLLASALPLGLVAQLAVEQAGFAPQSGVIAALVIAVVFNGWALKRRIS
jgi:hypothetical protein